MLMLTLISAVCVVILIQTALRILVTDKRKCWFAAFCSLAILGLIGGVTLGTGEYHYKSHIKIAGIPFALAIFQFENDGWTDYVGTPAQMWTIAAVNVLCWTTAAIAPIGLFLIIRSWLYPKPTLKVIGESVNVS